MQLFISLLSGVHPRAHVCGQQQPLLVWLLLFDLCGEALRMQSMTAAGVAAQGIT